VRGLERGEDPLGPGEQLEGLEDLGVADRLVAGAADRREVRVLRTDPG